MIEQLFYATLETLYMVFTSAFFAVLLGLPLGLFLVFSETLYPKPVLNRLVGSLVNVIRSFPFAILIIALIPFTRMVVGTSLGTTAAIVPLTLAATAFFARLAESSFKEVDRHLIDSVRTMKASPLQLAFYVLIPEALPSLLLALSNLLVNLIGYSTLAGLVGGGGLGKVAIYYGYYQFNVPLMIATVVLLILIVEGIQSSLNRAAQTIKRQRGL